MGVEKDRITSMAFQYCISCGLDGKMQMQVFSIFAELRKWSVLIKVLHLKEIRQIGSNLSEERFELFAKVS